MRALAIAAVTLCACINFDQLERNAKCDAGFGCSGGSGGGAATGGGGGAATGGGGGATGGGGGSGGGTAGGSICPSSDAGWSLAYGGDAGQPDASVYATLPWGLTTAGCNVHVLAMQQLASTRSSAQLLTLDSLGNTLSTLPLGPSARGGDEGAFRLASLGTTLVAGYPTPDAGGQLVVLDATATGATERRRSSAPFQVQAVALEPNAPNPVAHLFGTGVSTFVYSRVDLTSPPGMLGTDVITSCAGSVDVRRAVIAPDGFLVFAGTYQAPCTIGQGTFDAGQGLFVGEMAPASTAAVVIDVPQGRMGEFSHISIAAGSAAVWITYGSMTGAAVSKVIRSGAAPNFTLSIASTTASMNGRTLPGDIAFSADGGLEVVGTVLSQGDTFGGVPLIPDAGDYDAWLLRFDPMQGMASNAQLFGTTGTDGFTHVVPVGSGDVVAGICGYGGGPLPLCVSSLYMNFFVLGVPR